MRRKCKRCEGTENISPWAKSKYCHDCQVKNYCEKRLAEGKCPKCTRDMDNEYSKCNYCLRVAKELRDQKSLNAEETN